MDVLFPYGKKKNAADPKRPLTIYIISFLIMSWFQNELKNIQIPDIVSISDENWESHPVTQL